MVLVLVCITDKVNFKLARSFGFSDFLYLKICIFSMS